MRLLFAILLMLCFFHEPLYAGFSVPEVHDSDSYYPIVENGKWGFIDRNGKVVITPRFEDANYFSEGLAAVKLNGKYGYIDRQGEIVIMPDFEFAATFASGVAIIKIVANDRKTRQYGLINTKGDIIVQPDKAGIERLDNMFLVRKEPEGNYAVMLPDGRIVSDFIFLGWSAVSRGDDDEINAREFRAEMPVIGEDIGPGDGLIQYMDKGLYGYMTEKGQVTIPAKFDFGYPFNNGEAVVKYNGLWGIIDKNGAFVVNPKYERLQKMGFNEGLCGVRVNGKWGFMDRKEKMVIKPQFWRVQHFSEGAAIYSVNTKKTNNPVKHGYIDRSGKPLFKGLMVYVEPYKDGLAYVTRTASEGSDPYVVDKKNREIFWSRFKGMAKWMKDDFVLIDRETKGYMILDRKTLKPLLVFDQKIYSIEIPVNGIVYVCFEKDKEKATYAYMNLKGEVIYRFTESGKANVTKTNF